MPLQSSTGNNDLVAKSEPYYTNEDVEILFKIVVHAQSLLPSLPERERVPTNALFAAYYELLPSIGIDADHDNRYARILFKIGGTRGEGSLFEKFEEVLSRMDIELEFDDHAPKDNSERVTKSKDQSRRGRQRRNSDSSLWNPETGPPRIQRPRRRSHSHISGAESVDVKKSVRRQPAAKAAGQAQPPSYGEIELHEKGQDLRAWLRAGSTDGRQALRMRSVSPYSSIAVHRRSLVTDDPDLATSSTLSFSPSRGQSLADGRISDNGREQQFSPRIKTINSDTLLEIKASIVEQHYYKRLLHQTWRRWCLKVVQLQEDNKNLDFLAGHQDNQVLLRQAFDAWRVTLLGARQRAETERFFAHLERRASRARDLFVLTKAFTHWAQTAYEEVQWTSAARRHILRARYFLPWRDIAAVNELKVRRHVLEKFFGVWQRNYSNTHANTLSSVIRFESDLVKRKYWKWFWSFCERRATPWWATRSKKSCLNAWIAKIRNVGQVEALAITFFSQQLKSGSCSSWILKQQLIASSNKAAYVYDRRSVSASILTRWHTTFTLQSAARQVQASAERRLTLRIFDGWAVRARQQRQASQIDTAKVKLEAWVIWNNKVRCQALQVRVGDRLLLQYLYRWVLTERMVLANRLLEQRLIRTMFLTMIRASKISLQRDVQDVSSAEDFDGIRTKRSLFKNWRTCLQIQLQREEKAVTLNSALVLSRALTTWSKHNNHLDQLETWSRDASFYFMARKSLKSWKDMTENSKREKRRNAYAQIRRQHKMRLASTALLGWHKQLRCISDIKALAVEFYSNKVVVMGMDVFDQWRSRAGDVAELHTVHIRILLRKRFDDLKVSVRDLQRLNAIAVNSFEDRLTSKCLKDWGRNALQLRALEHVVSEVREKHIKKSSRKMVLHWRQRLLLKRKRISFDVDEESSTTQGVTEKAETWSDNGEVLNIPELSQGFVIGPSVVPGYLMTPSRKSTRAMTVAKYSSTTPSAPLLTPIERRLRAQYSGGSISSYRRAHPTVFQTNDDGFLDVQRNPAGSGEEGD